MRDIGKLANNLNTLVDGLDKINGKNYVQSYLKMGAQEYARFLKLQEAPFIDVMDAFSSLGITLDSLQDDVIDILCVDNKLKNRPHLPSKYEVEARSRWIVTQNVIKELRRSYGEHEYEQALQYFQISPEHLDACNSDKHVSTELNSDIYKYIKNYLNGNSTDIYRLGANMFRHFINTDFSKSFEGLSAKETYEKYLEEVVNHIEKSYVYSLYKLTDEMAIIHKKLRPETKEQLKGKAYGSKEVCEYSLGFSASILFHSSRTLAQAFETQCLYDGAPHCEYVVYFDRPTPIVC